MSTNNAAPETVAVPKSFLTNVVQYMQATGSALSKAAERDKKINPQISETVDHLISLGFIGAEKRAEAITDLTNNPERVYAHLRKIATHASVPKPMGKPGDASNTKTAEKTVNTGRRVSDADMTFERAMGVA